MNFVAYNLFKYRRDYKISFKELSTILKVPKKTIRNWEKGITQPTEVEIVQLANLFHVDYLSFQNEAFEIIDLQKKKIYGTNYTHLKYQVNQYQTHRFPLFSVLFDLFVVLCLIIFAILKKLPLEEGSMSILSILKIVFLVEMFVTPLLSVALPLLKLYYNRSYVVSIDTIIHKNHKEEIEGIVESQLVKNIHKSVFISLFTIFSQLCFVIYVICYMIDLKDTSIHLFIFLVTCLVAIIFSMILIIRYYVCYRNQVEAIHMKE